MQNRGHDAISETMSKRFLAVPWRVGRKVPRNLYAQTNSNTAGQEDDGVIFGQLDSSWLAEHVVALHNASIEDPPPAPLTVDPAMIIEKEMGLPLPPRPQRRKWWQR